MQGTTIALGQHRPRVIPSVTIQAPKTHSAGVGVPSPRRAFTFALNSTAGSQKTAAWSCHALYLVRWVLMLGVVFQAMLVSFLL